LGTFFQLPIWIVYQSKFLSFEQIAFYSGLALVTEVVMQLPTGAFADIFGRRWSLSLGNLFMAIPMFLIALYPKPEIMWLYAFAWGLGRAFAMGTSKPMLYETITKYGKVEMYPKILSRSVLVFQISAAISIASGGYLYQISPSLPYLFSGFASLIGVGTAFFFIEERALKTKFVLNEFVQTAKNGFSEIFKNSYMAKLTLLYVFMVGIALTNQQFFAQPFMVELGMNDISRSWAAMIIKVIIALIGVKILATKSIFKNKMFILIIPALMVISLLPAGFTHLPFAYLILLGIAFTSGNADMFISPEVHEHLSSSVRSTAVSAQKMVASTIGAIVQWISAPIILAQSVGSFYTYLGVFSLVLIFPLALSVMRHKHKISISMEEVLEGNSI
jgi:MFS family permease